MGLATGLFGGKSPLGPTSGVGMGLVGSLINRDKKPKASMINSAAQPAGRAKTLLGSAPQGIVKY